MYRPAYGPLSTLMIGAYGPNPLIPSCTIVPEAIATSVTWAPQALLTVPMSMPWSSVQALAGSTRESGLSGKTIEPEGAVVDAGAGTAWRPPSLAAARTAYSSVAAVLRPTVPLGGLRRLATWNRLTAALVTGPKLPSAEILYPTSVSHVCSVR